MILLDTNVISEMMRPKPDESVAAWFDQVDALPLYVSSVTEAELWSGLFQLPEGKRRSGLQTLIADTLREDFAGRILTFDSAAALAYGNIYGDRTLRGRPISMADCQIAAIAQVHRLRLATRNSRDFEHCGIDVINPWATETATR